ncbi:tRNA (adenosine(37)-N6)-dimethylallyltransferase MiaA [Buchnera aphidicola]|uniref:tRNA dimethylallyltransferase n=1 Tax=Buchnera aphidicola (Stegophylla sp.) TaxID=2315800 RepID=A0A4D6YN99_9GAMM|nr:tRNA (adenosine(37)-N6)-dimethylallyltransferase MiaA [Buchnera aphidicola (Stegophylla sp.)]QCI26515.1 tRNA (adenosine(37)-N6)-dimethylallyltransferase MiaA [Buchnera aphidicola (Stegophylla sp.)]
MKIYKKNLCKSFLIFLLGPTASGKSTLAMELRKYLPVELISVDSALIYRHMNIGTAKPNKLQLIQHPHRLINIKDPSQYYSVSEFRYDVLREINDILKLGKIPLLVGGTMFYYHILLNGISQLPKSNLELKKKILRENNYNHNYSLHKYLSKIDIISSKNIHPNDVQRLLRALEVCLITGKKFSQLKKNILFRLPYKTIQFVRVLKKKKLYHNIENRLGNMLDQGFEMEVMGLFNRGDLNIHLPSIRCIGYRHMWFYLSGLISYGDMIKQIIVSTKQLVKKQITWLKTWNNIYLLKDTKMELIIEKILNVIYKEDIMYG